MSGITPDQLTARLEMARGATAAADGKAGQLLSATGVLLTGGGVLAATSRPAGFAAVLTAAAGAAVALAVLALLHVTLPRGGPARRWLLPSALTAGAELERVVAIVETKHRGLRVASFALAAAVGLALAAAFVEAVAR